MESTIEIFPESLWISFKGQSHSMMGGLQPALHFNSLVPYDQSFCTFLQQSSFLTRESLMCCLSEL
jgi:hypothetical protein